MTISVIIIKATFQQIHDLISIKALSRKKIVLFPHREGGILEQIPVLSLSHIFAGQSFRLRPHVCPSTSLLPWNLSMRLAQQLTLYLICLLFRSFLKDKVLAWGSFPFTGSRTWLWFSMWILKHDKPILFFGICGFYWRNAYLLYLYWTYRQKGFISPFPSNHARGACPNLSRWSFAFHSVDNRRNAVHLLWMWEWISVCILFQYISGCRGMENQLYKLT